MSRVTKAILVAALLVIAAILVTAGYGWRLLAQPHRPAGGEVVVDIPAGYGSEEIVELLVANDILEYRYPALIYLYFSDHRGRLQAGEYVFGEMLDVDGVFRKLSTGDIRLYPFTVPEGLRVEQIADIWEESDFGSSEEFREAVAAVLPAVLEMDPRAVSVEGYLFPETYLFPRNVTAAQAVDAMLAGFRTTIRNLEEIVDRAAWPLDLHDTLVMASLVESEAAVADERSVISSVFHNRLDRGMKLDCDPTVIYALIQAGQYRGRLLIEDLTFDSEYNTYVYGGLPPGPISNPGLAPLIAAIQPDTTDFIFFVRTEGGRHTFSRTLAEHNRAVAAYRNLQ